MSTIHQSLLEDFHNRESFLKDPSQKKILAKLIDSTLLKPNATKDDFLKLFSDANEHLFKSVCIPPSYVSLAKKHCKVVVCTVIGFPNGYNTIQNKVSETQEAIQLGAEEIDFVHNITLVKSQDWKNLANEYSKIVKVAQENITKLILETSLLTDDEIKQCTMLAADCGVNIIKTSTGFGSRGASENDIKFIQASLQKFFAKKPQSIGIKASGGVRTFEEAFKMVTLSATRLGTTNGVQIINMVKQHHHKL